jgi:glutamine amidotransferase
LCIHNGRIENFRQTLCRPLCDRLGDVAYQSIKGSTDSEHLFALIINELQANPSARLEQALQSALLTLNELAKSHQVVASANIIVSDGHRLVASRFASDTAAPLFIGSGTIQLSQRRSLSLPNLCLTAIGTVS